MEFGRPPVDQDYSDPGFCPEMANYYFFIYYFFFAENRESNEECQKKSWKLKPNIFFNKNFLCKAFD